MKMPKTLAGCVDALYKIRHDRLKLQQEVDALAADEAELREHLIKNLPKSQATGISGKLATAKIENKTTVTVKDWDKLYAYIIKNAKKGSFALLQRRVSAAAVEEIWAEKKAVPGVEPFKVPVVSLTKR